MARADIPLTPFDRIGGEAAIRRLVDRFYDLMDSDPAYAALRAMHRDDLLPMRVSLTSFLMAWMGGPPHWFEREKNCVMSLHRHLHIDQELAGQWLHAMGRAASDTINDPPFVESMVQAFSHMAAGMVTPRQNPTAA